MERPGGLDFLALARRGFRVGGRADFKRKDPDRIDDILEFFRAEIAGREVKPPRHLALGVLGETNRAGLGDALKTRGDIDAVAHQIAIRLLDHVAEVDADAELNAPLGRQAGVALEHAVLHLDGATHGVDHTAKLDQAAVTGAFDYAPMMRRDRRINQIAA